MGQFDPATDTFRVDPTYRALVRSAGLDARGVFDDPRVHAWRLLPDRQNCTLDVPADDLPPDALPADVLAAAGDAVRLHVKRYAAAAADPSPADVERDGHQLLVDADVPTAPLVAWGRLTDHRSFTIWLDLAGYTPGDKLVAGGFDFERLLRPTAELAAKLHAAGLHHRDLYLCHFMARATSPDAIDVRLIDVARVARLPRFFTRRRWVVKDLAQFWYSTTKLAVTDDQRDRWLAVYAAARGGGVTPATYRRSVVRKAASIARKDERLKRKRPERDVSIAGKAGGQ